MADCAETDGILEAGEQEWFWCAPLVLKRFVAAVFVDPRRLLSKRPESLETIYLRLLKRFRLLRLHSSISIEGGVMACDASSRYAKELVGPGFVRIGDASITLDPLSSQGIKVAIASALQAAIVLNTLLKCPENSETAMKFYRDRQKEKVQEYARKTALFYKERATVCNHEFWLQRAVVAADQQMFQYTKEKLDPTCRIQISNFSTIENMPVIQGDIVVSSLAVHNPMLKRPVAFVGDTQIVPLLQQIRSGQPADAVVQTWARRLSLELSWKIMEWMWNRRIVVSI